MRIVYEGPRDNFFTFALLAAEISGDDSYERIDGSEKIYVPDELFHAVIELVSDFDEEQWSYLVIRTKELSNKIKFWRIYDDEEED